MLSNAMSAAMIGVVATTNAVVSPEDPGTQLALFINVVVAGLFTFDWYRSLGRYLKWGDARSLRNFTKSIVLTALAYSAFVRTALFIFIGPTADSVIVLTLWTVALCGGIVMVVTWQREGEA